MKTPLHCSFPPSPFELPTSPFVRSVIERFRPATIVMSQNEIHPKSKIRTLGQV